MDLFSFFFFGTSVWDRLELQNPNAFKDYNKGIQSKIQKQSTKNSAPPKVPLPPKGNFLLYHFIAMKMQHWFMTIVS